MATFPLHRTDPPLAEDAPQADTDTSEAGEEGQIIRGAVAGQPVGALAVAIFADHRVTVVDGAVEEVEDISTENGARVITPQFWERPPMPKVCAIKDGKTPNRKPYATPVKPETTTNVLGLEMENPQN